MSVYTFESILFVSIVATFDTAMAVFAAWIGGWKVSAGRGATEENRPKLSSIAELVGPRYRSGARLEAGDVGER